MSASVINATTAQERIAVASGVRLAPEPRRSQADAAVKREVRMGVVIFDVPSRPESTRFLSEPEGGDA